VIYIDTYRHLLSSHFQVNLGWLVAPLILSLQSSWSLASSQDRPRLLKQVGCVTHKLLLATPHPLALNTSQEILKQSFYRMPSCQRHQSIEGNIKHFDTRSKTKDLDKQTKTINNGKDASCVVW